jgi:hypothetical protein
MVPFLGHGMVPTLCSVRKKFEERNGSILVFDFGGTEQNGTWHAATPHAGTLAKHD